MTDSTPPAELVRLAIADGVATVTLDNPRNRNALSLALVDQLLAALARAGGDPDVRVIVLSHTGPVFCSGADLRETAAASAEGTVPVARMGEAIAAIWECPKPVLARVGGPARAGGLGLIAAADLAICAAEATFAFTEVRIGVIPAVISAVVLPRLAPRAAAELFLSGDLFDGTRAAEVGLVTRAVPAAGLDAAVASQVAALTRGAPAALAGTKDLLRHPDSATLRSELDRLTALSVQYFRSPEGVEGVSAFAEKRDPSWVLR
jgi:methylglutaconyl-CoA hydratase